MSWLEKRTKREIAQAARHSEVIVLVGVFCAYVMNKKEFNDRFGADSSALLHRAFNTASEWDPAIVRRTLDDIQMADSFELDNDGINLGIEIARRIDDGEFYRGS